MLARLPMDRISSSLPVEAALVDLGTQRTTLVALYWITCMCASEDLDIIPKVMAIYSSVDCTVDTCI